MSSSPNMVVPVDLFLDIISLAQETHRRDVEKHEATHSDTKAIKKALQCWRDHMAAPDEEIG